MPFNNVIPEEERTLDYSKVLCNELSGILNWALEGLRSLRQNRSFVEPEICLQMQEQYRDDCDPTREYLLNNYEECPNAYVTKKDVYQDYCQYMKDHGNHPMASNTFAQCVKREFKKVCSKRLEGLIQ